jgi:hypothetical protein
MEIEILTIGDMRVTLLKSPGVVISGVQDALDLMGETSYRESYRIIVHKDQMTDAFFDLKTGIAGEILQKFSTYNLKLAIIGDFSRVTSNSLRDFIRESNRYGRINFVSTLEEAKEKLLKP